MKKNALRKDFFIEVKKTSHRFLSIFCIVALGVAFFVGIRSTQPDMKRSADQFYDQSKLMDARIIGTLGLTEGDVAAVASLDGVETVEGAYSLDMLCTYQNKQVVVKVLSIPMNMNKIIIKEGRPPEMESECIVDVGFLEKTGYQIGDSIRLEPGTDEDVSDTLKRDQYTITGSCVTSYYMGLTRGTSSIGNGDISSFIMLPGDSFSLETYTDIYFTVDGAQEMLCYSDAYEEKIESMVDKVEAEVKEERITARYDEVIGKANETLEEAKSKLKLEEGKADKKLADAKKKLDKAARDLEDGRNEIAENEKKLADAKIELEKAKQDLQEGREKKNAGEVEVAKARGKIEDGEKEYSAGYQEYLQKKAELDAGKKELDAMKSQLEYIEDEEQLAAAKSMWKEQTSIWKAGEQGLKKAADKLAIAKRNLDAAKSKVEAGEKELALSEETIQEGGRKIAEAEQDIADGDKKIADGKKEMKKGERKLKKAEKKYEDGKQEAEEKIQDAEVEIKDAEKEIKKIKKPKWYVLDRNSIQTYVEYGQDADRIRAVGDVFPAIFFLVAALVSLTTMTRMVEEERTQIGTLKALGYSKLSIASKYLLYALLATLGGSLFGGLIGGKALPYIIIDSYKIMYRNLEVIATPIQATYLSLAAFIAVSCVLLATFFACYKELAASPAELMRPSAPKQGKRVLLERMPFLWKHLNFTGKSTIRNLIRYKKRFLMTIFGIGGCMALLLVGFGLKDSIFSIVTLQFGQIFKYNAIVLLDEAADNEEEQQVKAFLDKNEKIRGFESAMDKSMEVGFQGEEKTAYLTVFQQPDKMRDYIHLRDRKTHKEYKLNDEEVVLTEKLSSLLHVKVGDSISLKNDDRNPIEVKVGAISENYVYHYVYMTPLLYSKLYGGQPEYNEFYLAYAEDGEKFENAFSEELLRYDAVATINSLETSKKRFEDMLESLNIVIVILVLAAGGLAFVVLFNLNNINITERIRELATIKVLGFYDMEVSAYVFRENIILTVIGGLLGVVMGAMLHRFVILTVEVDITMFGRNIDIFSYVKSLAITFLFSALVNFSMHFKLKKIDMAASLKSVE